MHAPRKPGMKRLTHYKTSDRGTWRKVNGRSDGVQLDENRLRQTVISGKRYIYVVGVSARELRFNDGSIYHAESGWA